MIIIIFYIFLPDFNVAIEYQGEQHYSPINRGYYDNDSFLELKKRDNLKKEYCLNKRIKLVEIPYTDYDKINLNYIKGVIE